MHILVIGGGFAGVWSAAAAARVAGMNGSAGTRPQITLVSDSDELVIRPRLYERDPGRMSVSLDRVLTPIGVERVRATVTGIDTATRTVTAVGADGAPRVMTYDRLVLAAGSHVVEPTVVGRQFLFDVDTITSADALEQHLRALPEGTTKDGTYSAVVIGAGFTGLEVATELMGRLQEFAHAKGARARVVLVDRAGESVRSSATDLVRTSRQPSRTWASRFDWEPRSARSPTHTCVSTTVRSSLRRRPSGPWECSPVPSPR